MSSHMVPPGAWYDLAEVASQVIVGDSPLNAPGFRARWEIGADPETGLLHVRCGSPLLAGLWLRHRCPGLTTAVALPDPADTASFLAAGRLETDVHTIRPRQRGDLT